MQTDGLVGPMCSVMDVDLWVLFGCHNGCGLIDLWVLCVFKWKWTCGSHVVPQGNWTCGSYVFLNGCGLVGPAVYVDLWVQSRVSDLCLCGCGVCGTLLPPLVVRMLRFICSQVGWVALHFLFCPACYTCFMIT